MACGQWDNVRLEVRIGIQDFHTILAHHYVVDHCYSVCVLKFQCFFWMCVENGILKKQSKNYSLVVFCCLHLDLHYSSSFE